jgi:hypothetical protein
MVVVRILTSIGPDTSCQAHVSVISCLPKRLSQDAAFSTVATMLAGAQSLLPPYYIPPREDPPKPIPDRPPKRARLTKQNLPLFADMTRRSRKRTGTGSYNPDHVFNGHKLPNRRDDPHFRRGKRQWKLRVNYLPSAQLDDEQPALEDLSYAPPSPPNSSSQQRKQRGEPVQTPQRFIVQVGKGDTRLKRSHAMKIRHILST